MSLSYVRAPIVAVIIMLLASAASCSAPRVDATPTLTSVALMAVRPTIVLITIDTLRADHLSSYGYGRQTSPNIDAVAAAGARFAHVTSASSWTLPANAALHTGRLPSDMGATMPRSFDAYPGDNTPLAEHLHNVGYYTVGFCTNYFVSNTFGFGQGYDIYEESLVSRPRSDALAEDTTNQALGWVDTNWSAALSNTHPLFLSVYYYDPHTWYNPPAPYDTMYDSTYTGPFTPEVFEDGKGVIEGRLTPNARDVEHLIALYDGEINYTDAEVGRLLAGLEQRGMLENALVIITSDHGEQFGEHNKWNHANTLYEEAIRVPLIMRYPGAIPPGTVINTPVQSMDLMPTILDWSGIPRPANLDAISLRPYFENNPPPARPIYSEVDAITNPNDPGYWHTSFVNMRSVLEGNEKLIHKVDHAEQDELYTLNPSSTLSAPYETTNRAATAPERLNALRKLVAEKYALYRGMLPLVRKP